MRREISRFDSNLLNEKLKETCAERDMISYSDLTSKIKGCII